MKSYRDWSDELARAVSGVRDEDLRTAAAEIARARITVTAGNGGSAAIASHLAQAIMKPDYRAGGGRPAVCLTDAVPTLTAHANDGGWPGALGEVARPFLDRMRGCLLVAISSSGRSENVAVLAKLARAAGCPVVALTGFQGEPLRSIATLSIHVESEDYEVVEPAHDALVHRVQYHLREIAS